MGPKETAKQVVLDLLEEQALALGGCVAIGDIPDPAVWRLVRALEAAGSRVLGELDEPEAADAREGLNLTPHPAVEYLLHRLREH